MKCAQCGKEHPRTAMELSYKRPDAIHQMSKDDRAENVRETDDQCRTTDGRYFVRGVIPISVEGREQAYSVGAWVQIDESAYQRISDLWDDPDQAREPPFPATLANNIYSYPDTLGLPVTLQLSGATTRPSILIPESPHPLHRDQCLGITEHRVHEYSRSFSK